MSISDFNTGQFNWRFYASNIKSNANQNLTLDSSGNTSILLRINNTNKLRITDASSIFLNILDLSGNNLENVNQINFLNNNIKIGSNPGILDQSSNTIIINASGNAVPSTNSSATYISPIRNVTQSAVLGYNASTKEITYFTNSGGGSSLPNRTNYADYIYWDSSSSAWTVGNTDINLGAFAGQNGQKTNAISIGYQAGQNTQGTRSIAIGYQAGLNTQGLDSIAIGTNAGQTKQSSYTIAIGNQAALTNQIGNSIAIGNGAGNNYQGNGTS